jgi:hypothetical protein
MSPPSSKTKNRFTNATCFTLVSCLAYSSMHRMEATCSSVTSVDFNRLHGVISQKIELFCLKIGFGSFLTHALQFTVRQHPQLWSCVTYSDERKRRFVNQDWIFNSLPKHYQWAVGARTYTYTSTQSRRFSLHLAVNFSDRALILVLSQVPVTFGKPG